MSLNFENNLNHIINQYKSKYPIEAVNGKLERVTGFIPKVREWIWGIDEETTAVIHATCMQVLNQLSESYERYKVDASNQETIKYTCKVMATQELRKGLSSLYEIYPNNRLRELMNILDGSISIHKKNVDLVVEDEAEERNNPLIEQRNGMGPNYIETIISPVTTFSYLLIDILKVDCLENRGKMLTGSIVHRYINKLREDYNFNVIEELYLRDSVNNMTLQEIKNLIESCMRDFTETSSPLIIPIVVGGSSLLELKHIVTIIVKDGVIVYFDPKGKFSQHQLLSNGHSLYDLLTFLNQEVNSGAGDILENHMVHQLDINNCGVFCCYFIKEILKESLTRPFLFEEKISLPKIQEFRKEIKEILDIDDLVNDFSILLTEEEKDNQIKEKKDNQILNFKVSDSDSDSDSDL